jgi:hypothetical protein
MYTIANKHNKKTRKLPSSSRNKHKSKSKSNSKNKHKYTIGKTRKHTKSHNSLYSGGTFPRFIRQSQFVKDFRQQRGMNGPGGSFPQQQELEIQKMEELEKQRTPRSDASPILSTPLQADVQAYTTRARTPLRLFPTDTPTIIDQSQTPKEETPFTFDDFKAKVIELTKKLNTNYTPQTLFSDLTVAAKSITSEDDKQKAMDIVRSMNIFYSNNFPTNKRLMAFLKKFPKVTFTPLNSENTFKQNLSPLGLDQDSTKAIADALKKSAQTHTLQTTITPSDAIPSDEKILLIHATSTPNTTTTTNTTTKKVSTQQKEKFVEMKELSTTDTSPSYNPDNPLSDD